MQVKSIDSELLSFYDAVNPMTSSMESSYSTLLSTLSSISSVFTSYLSSLSSYFESNASSRLQTEIATLQSSYNSAQSLCESDLRQILNGVTTLLSGIASLKTLLEQVNNAIAYYNAICHLSEEEQDKRGVDVSGAYHNARSLSDAFDTKEQSLKNELSTLKASSFNVPTLAVSTAIDYNNLHVISSEIKEFTFTCNGETKRYLLYIPTLEEGDVELPLITFLHGSGEAAAGLGLLKRTDFVNILRKKKYPAYVLMPLTSDMCWDRKNSQDILEAATEIVLNEYPIDTDCMAITGYSSGGIGLYSAVSNNPDRYSIAVSVAGRLPHENVDTAAIASGNTDFYLFHGTVDDTVEYKKGQNAKEELIAAGVKNVDFTPLSGYDHDIITNVFSDKDYISKMIDKMYEKKLNS